MGTAMLTANTQEVIELFKFSTLITYNFLFYNLDNLRVLKKNLLFCSGLPLSLSED
jgi:hypothetical protein